MSAELRKPLKNSEICLPFTIVGVKATRRTLSSLVKLTWISLQTTCMQENLRGIEVRSSSATQWTKRSGRPLKTLAITFGFAFTAIFIFPSRELTWTADVTNERDNILGITMHCGKALVSPLAIPSQNLAQDWAPQILDWGYLVIGAKLGHPQKACIQC